MYQIHVDLYITSIAQKKEWGSKWNSIGEIINQSKLEILITKVPINIMKVSQLVSSTPKYWSFSFSIIPSKEHSGLISFRMDWLDLLAVQGTLKSLLQHCSSKALILQHSAFFTVQLSHPNMTTGKTIALTRQTFAGKVCLCFLICCLGWS